MRSPSCIFFFLESLSFANPTPPASIITLSNPSNLFFSWCSNVINDPEINGCPNLFPKSEAPLDAFINISVGF